MKPEKNSFSVAMVKEKEIDFARLLNDPGFNA